MFIGTCNDDLMMKRYHITYIDHVLHKDDFHAYGVCIMILPGEMHMANTVWFCISIDREIYSLYFMDDMIPLLEANSIGKKPKLPKSMLT